MRAMMIIGIAAVAIATALVIAMLNLGGDGDGGEVALIERDEAPQLSDSRDGQAPAPPPGNAALRAGAEFDLTKALTLAELRSNNLAVAEEDIRAIGPFDAVAALDHPQRIAAAASELSPDAMVAAVEIGGEAVAYPMALLEAHQVINDTISNVPLAVTFCPISESIAVFHRKFAHKRDGEAVETMLKFGVSGLAVHSNSILFDREFRCMWIQSARECISGPLAGTRLEPIEHRQMTIEAFATAHPQGLLASVDKTD